MAEATEPLIQECAACGALIDVSEEDPMALMHCPTCGAAMRVRKQFGNFELLEILGAGGMGAVYRALDLTLNRSVALKLLRREYSEHPDYIQQFAHEAALTALINHPNVVKVYSTGADHGLFYIAMELVDKGSLDDLMALQKKVPEPQVLEVGIQIAMGLRAAYRSGLMHRDVKPGNILFADVHHSKIVDFGLAAPIESASEVGGEVWGTPYYVAPEKLETPTQEDFRSDIYSLGATLFHALAGRPPYEAEDASLLALKHLKSQPVSLQAFAPSVSSSTAYVINRTLHKDPDQRYASYDELIEHLEFARNELFTKAVAPKVPKARIVIEDSGSQRAMSVITLIMLIALGVGGYFVYQHRAEIFPTAVPTRPADADKARKAAAQVKPRYEAARQLMLVGQYEEAAAEFRKLSESPAVPQPLLDWAALHAGLSTVLAGKLDDAHGDFEKLSKFGPFSQDPFDREFADFMTKTATRMLDDNPVTPEEAASYNQESFQAIALLLFGAKDWEMGETESAEELFHRFDSATPAPPDDWIAEYKRIPKRFDESLEKYKTFADQVKAAGEGEKAKPEIPKLKDALAALQLKGALLKKGKRLIAHVQQTVDDFDAEQKAAQTEMEDSDAKALAEIRAKADPLAQEFKFKQAYAEAKAAQVITDKGKADKKGLMNRYDWLVSFKAALAQDFGTHGYTAGLRRKNGAAVAGSITDADDTNVIVKLPNGTLSVPWTDIAFESLVAMARAFLRPELPPDRLADRQWYLGVYCVLAGKPAEASPYFREAVKNKPEYAAQWKLFPDVPQ